MKSNLTILFLLCYSLIKAQTDTTTYGYTYTGIFKPAEIPVVFGGGVTALERYLENNLNFPKDAKKKKIQGTVIIEFTVDKESRISDIQLIQSVYPSIDEEAIRLINLTIRGNHSMWIPAQQNGNSVKFRTRVSIAFGHK